MSPRVLAITSLAALFSVACAQVKRTQDGAAAVSSAPLSTTVTATELSMFAPLPEIVQPTGAPVTEAQVALGRALFYEPLLSVGHDVSCNGCHALNAWGADGRSVSLGHDGRAGKRNAPTVYNAAGQFAQFWDGRAKDVEEQAKGPILNPIEMGMPDTAAVLAHLRGSSMYVARFRAAFPDERAPITYDNVGRAIGAFERGLVTPAPWDRFLAGDSTALTIEQRQGLRAYLNTGCQACHSGPYLGGDRYMRVGVANAWPSAADSGRMDVTREAKDAFVFKVPTLRNVEKTGPYFHDGSVADLSEAVRLMAHHQLGKDLAPSEVKAIVTYLGSLTGSLPSDYIAYPQKPK